MKVRVPLFVRILLWFFLNLALLGIGFYLLVRAQFVFDKDFLLTASAADRIQNLANQLTAEMQEHPRSEWDAIVARYKAKYAVDCYVFGQDGRPLAGEPRDLPPEIHSRVARRPPPGPRPPRPDQEREFNPEDRPPPPRGGEPDPATLPSTHLLLRVGRPARYWAFVRASLTSPERATTERASVAIASDSLSAGGLFLDLRPWYVAIFGAAVFSGLFWLPFVRGITKSVSQMTKATQQIAQGRFDVQAGVRRTDELGTLGQTIDSMAVRLDGLVNGQKRFLGDIAHELCAPLARLRVALGILEERVDEKQRPDVARANQKADEIANLVNELLSFSKAALGARQVNLQPVLLREIAETAIRREASDGARIEIDVAPDLRGLAESELLTRALGNLLRNAIRYAGANGTIKVAGEVRGKQVVLLVADNGPGIPASELQKIFDPFYRLDASRDRQTGGVGLGLAIVKTCVEACEGTVVAENRLPSGLQVTITLAAPTAG